MERSAAPTSATSAARASTTASATGTTRATGIEAIDDASLFRVVRRHFQFHAVTGDEPDETLAHLARDVGEHEVTVFQFDPEHGAGKDGVNGAFEFYGFFLFRHNREWLARRRRPPTLGKRKDGAVFNQGKRYFRNFE